MKPRNFFLEIFQKRVPNLKTPSKWVAFLRLLAKVLGPGRENFVSSPNISGIAVLIKSLQFWWHFKTFASQENVYSKKILFIFWCWFWVLSVYVFRFLIPQRTLKWLFFFVFPELVEHKICSFEHLKVPSDVGNCIFFRQFHFFSNFHRPAKSSNLESPSSIVFSITVNIERVSLLSRTFPRMTRPRNQVFFLFSPPHGPFGVTSILARASTTHSSLNNKVKNFGTRRSIPPIKHNFLCSKPL